MQDNKYNVGDEVWFFEGDTSHIFNGFVASWQLTSERMAYDYVILTSESSSVKKSESELFIKRDDAATQLKANKDAIAAAVAQAPIV